MGCVTVIEYSGCSKAGSDTRDCSFIHELSQFSQIRVTYDIDVDDVFTIIEVHRLRTKSMYEIASYYAVVHNL